MERKYWPDTLLLMKVLESNHLIRLLLLLLLFFFFFFIIIIITGAQQNDLLHRARPDIAIETRDTLTVIELTCPYETNTTKSREYKETRYKEIKSELLTPPSNFQLIFLEVTSLGFVTKNIKTFRNFLKSININERYLIEKLQEVAIRCSYFIYCRRKKNLISGGCFCTCSVVLCY